MKPVVLGAAVIVWALSGQTPAVAPAFEVAVVRPNRSGRNGIGGRGVCISGGRVMVSNIPLSLILEQVYDVKEFQLAGRPSWLTTERFDIEAKAGAPVAYERCQQMMQTLLADRFGLALHRETRQLPIYRLVLARNGPKGLHKPDAGAPLGIKTFLTGSKGQIDTWAISMAQLAGMLARTGELENMVVDGTGLDGNYQFTLEWSHDSGAADATAGPSLFVALQEQLGLKLEATKGPVEVLVIDHIEKTPREP